MSNSKVIFAIFGDNQFIAWTYGMFTQLVRFPKIYGNSENQIDIVTNNAKSKIRKLKEKSTYALINPGLGVIDEGQNREKNILENYTTFELGVYYCEEADLNTEYLEKIKLSPDKKISLNE
jgi:hypothetical protein